MDISGIEVPAKRARKQTEKAEQASNQSKVRFASHYSHVTKGHKQQSSYSHTTTSLPPPTTHATTTPATTSTTTTMMKENKLLPSVALSNIDKASQLTLSEDQLICYGCKGGYRMVRATHGVHHGDYYWEVEVLPTQDSEAHVRLGWSTREGELQAPVGYDKHSYGYRDLCGAIVHESVRIDDYGEPYGPGDIIGCFISLNADDSSQNRIHFYKNGQDQGVAFNGAEVPFGVYFPAVSLYCKAIVRVNFGPTFIIKPELSTAFLPISELQPFNPEDRKVHEALIASIRKNLSGLQQQQKQQLEDDNCSKSTMEG